MQTQTYEAIQEAEQFNLTREGSQEPATKPVSVLLIEDNPGDARLIQFMIQDAGSNLFEIEHVERLSDAFERLDFGGIGLVLSDLSLPDSHGLDTFTQLHARAPHVPIIVLSGLNDTGLAVQAVHQGAQDYLIKGQVAGQLLVRAMHYAIERKRMTEQLAHYADELRLKNAELEADFNMAREIQQILLPHEFPVFPVPTNPHESALRFSQRYLPAAAVGGDFFDIFAIDEHLAGIFICDVMGHGMRAALVTAILRGLVEKLAPTGNDPGEFLTELNKSLHAILRRTQEPFPATAFYLVADARDNTIRFANAGHPSPYRVRRDSATAESLKIYDGRHGPALGLFGKSVYPTCISPANPGDLFFLFTDGIYEVEDETQEEYGQERLLAAVSRRYWLPGDELFNALLAEVRAFSHSTEFPDDVCLVGMEIHSAERLAKGKA